MNTSDGVPGMKKPEVLITDGALLVDGVRIPLPARPQNEIAGAVYDVLSIIGVAISIVLVIAQLLVLHSPAVLSV